MNLLARREHSRQELSQKLSHKGFQAEEIQQTLGRLAEQSLQCDQRFAHSFARQRAMNAYGPLRIQFELQQRGISDTLIQSVLQEHADSWLQSAADLQQKKFGELPVDYKTRARQQRFLQNRGFDFDVINKVFSDK